MTGLWIILAMFVGFALGAAFTIYAVWLLCLTPLDGKTEEALFNGSHGEPDE